MVLVQLVPGWVDGSNDVDGTLKAGHLSRQSWVKLCLERTDDALLLSVFVSPRFLLFFFYKDTHS